MQCKMANDFKRMSSNTPMMFALSVEEAVHWAMLPVRTTALCLV